MGERMGEQFPALQSRKNRFVDEHKADEVRRVLWRALQHGSLSEEEFASTMERLEFANGIPEANPEFAFSALNEK